MQLIYKVFCAAGIMGITAAATAQTTPPATTQQTPPDEPGAATPPTNPSSAAPGQMQTTPGQTQTTPGEATQTTPPQTAKAVPATAADLKTGSSVYDQNGDLVGKIKSVDSKGAVVDTGKVSVDIPLKSIAKNDKGLAIGMTKDEIEAAAQKSPPKPK